MKISLDGIPVDKLWHKIHIICIHWIDYGKTTRLCLKRDTMRHDDPEKHIGPPFTKQTPSYEYTHYKHYNGNHYTSKTVSSQWIVAQDSFINSPSTGCVFIPDPTLVITVSIVVLAPKLSVAPCWHFDTQLCKIILLTYFLIRLLTYLFTFSFIYSFSQSIN